MTSSHITVHIKHEAHGSVKYIDRNLFKPFVMRHAASPMFDSDPWRIHSPKTCVVRLGMVQFTSSALFAEGAELQVRIKGTMGKLDKISVNRLPHANPII